LFVQERGTHLPLIKTALRLEESEAWRDSARYPMGAVLTDEQGGAWVILRDLSQSGRPGAQALRIKGLFEEARKAEQRRQTRSLRLG
jgi:hypothetical protein